MKYKNFMFSLLTNRGQFPPDHPKHRQAGLLNVALILLMLNSVAYFIIDLQLEDMVPAAIMNGVSAILSLAVFWYYRRTSNLHRSSLFAVLLIMIVLLTFLTVMENQNSAFYWLAVFPPTAYFLLGSRQGTIFTSLVSVYVIVFILTQYQSWEPEIFKLESFLNITGAMILIILLSHYHEHSREKASRVLEEANIKLQLLASIDRMTGLYNKAVIYDRLEIEMDRVQRYGEPLSILLLDIDHFKSINDTQGHLAGDTALIQLSNILVDCARKVDLIGRIGGDEFLIILPETGRDGALALADRIQLAVSDLDQIGPGPLTLSIGVTSCQIGESAADLLKRCDEALYRAKSEGRARICSAYPS